MNILNDALYGPSIKEDLVKKRLLPDNINGNILKGEEHLGIQKPSFGSVIITTREIGTKICAEYNEHQITHLKNKTFSHKFLCERRDDPAALLFLTLNDLVKNCDYTELDTKELCDMISRNIRLLIYKELPWLVNFSNEIIKNYYGMAPNKLKIKLNYILDDGIYESGSENLTKGGLLVNGLLDELHFYSAFLPKDVGFICQILCPSGLPRNRKWVQIDAGITSIGKREYKEDIFKAAVNNLRNTTGIILHPDILHAYSSLYYASHPSGSGYEGYQIFIWEVFYKDTIFFREIPSKKEFCKCDKRNSIIAGNSTF